MKDLKLVQFVQHYSPYVKGDIAGFKSEFVKKLVQAGKAVEYEAPKKAKSVVAKVEAKVEEEIKKVSTDVKKK
jgi:hypothetical protein